MTDQTHDETSSRVAALADEFPGYQFSYTDDGDSQSAPGETGSGRYRIVAQEAESWSGGGGTSAAGDSVDAAIEAIRSAMRSGRA